MSNMGGSKGGAVGAIAPPPENLGFFNFKQKIDVVLLVFYSSRPMLFAYLVTYLNQIIACIKYSDINNKQDNRTCCVVFERRMTVYLGLTVPYRTPTSVPLSPGSMPMHNPPAATPSVVV